MDAIFGLPLPLSFVRARADVQFLVLSPGRALLRCDVTVPLTEEARAAVAAASRTPAPALEPAALADARVLLALARHIPYAIPAEVRGTVEADLARRRGADRTFGAAEMHRLLCLARLLALSYGESELSAARYQEACALDAARAAREPPQRAPPATAVATQA